MGQRLQRLRKAAGLSQSELGKAADIPVGSLRNWEQDRRTPLLDTAGKVARALGVTVDELITEPPAKPAARPKRRKG
jgi:transcriptional regulator with XRE-family HTH domain